VTGDITDNLKMEKICIKTSIDQINRKNYSDESIFNAGKRLVAQRTLRN
jgi:hypothetical protein